MPNATPLLAQIELPWHSVLSPLGVRICDQTVGSTRLHLVDAWSAHGGSIGSAHASLSSSGSPPTQNDCSTAHESRPRMRTPPPPPSTQHRPHSESNAPELHGRLRSHVSVRGSTQPSTDGSQPLSAAHAATSAGSAPAYVLEPPDGAGLLFVHHCNALSGSVRRKSFADRMPLLVLATMQKS